MRALVVLTVLFAGCGAEKEDAPSPRSAAPREVEPEAAVAPEPPPPEKEKLVPIPVKTKPPVTRVPKRTSWDPPADLAHLDATPTELRQRIDGLVETMMDVLAGNESLRARDKLVAIGKPAFPRILGAMAKARDTITDVDAMEERLLESSLGLADRALREMDGYLVAREKQPIRPGTDRKYIRYICRLHYRRWVERLRHLDVMPGPPLGYEQVRARIEAYVAGDAPAPATLHALFGVVEGDVIRMLQRWKADLVAKLLAKLKKERAARPELGRLLLRELEHEVPALRELAASALHALYGAPVEFDPAAPAEGVRRWRDVVEAAD